jgi:arginase
MLSCNTSRKRPTSFLLIIYRKDHGPRLLREAGLLHHLASLGWRVHDSPDLDFNNNHHMHTRESENSHSFQELPNAKNSSIVGRGCKMLADLVSREAMDGRFPMILGGDHSIGVGSLAGILRARPNTGVIW